MLRGLVLDEKTARRLLRGELNTIKRKRYTKIREKVAIISGDKILGTIFIVSCKKKDDFYVWKFSCPAKFKRLIRIDRKKGQTFWIRLPKETIKAVLLEERNAIYTDERCRKILINFI
jgi:hypothetical protein